MLHFRQCNLRILIDQDFEPENLGRGVSRQYELIRERIWSQSGRINCWNAPPPAKVRFVLQDEKYNPYFHIS